MGHVVKRSMIILFIALLSGISWSATTPVIETSSSDPGVLPPQPIQMVKCQRWTVANTPVGGTPTPVQFPNGSCKSIGGGGKMAWGPPCWDTFLGPICLPLPPPWIGEPFRDKGYSFTCPSDYPYLGGYDEYWFGNFNSGGYTFVNNVTCCQYPNAVPMSGSMTWVQKTCK